MSRPKGTTKDNKRVMIAARVSKETKAIIKTNKINVGRYLDDKIGEDYREDFIC